MTRAFMLLLLFLLVIAPYMVGGRYTKQYEERTDFTNPVVVIVWVICALIFFYPTIASIRYAIRYRNVR